MDFYRQLLIGSCFFGLAVLSYIVTSYFSNRSISKNRLFRLEQRITQNIKDGAKWPFVNREEAERISSQPCPIDAYVALTSHRADFENILKALAVAREMKSEQKFRSN